MSPPSPPPHANTTTMDRRGNVRGIKPNVMEKLTNAPPPRRSNTSFSGSPLGTGTISSGGTTLAASPPLFPAKNRTGRGSSFREAVLDDEVVVGLRSNQQQPKALLRQQMNLQTSPATSASALHHGQVLGVGFGASQEEIKKVRCPPHATTCPPHRSFSSVL